MCRVSHSQSVIRFRRIGLGDFSCYGFYFKLLAGRRLARTDQALFIVSSRESYRTGRGGRQRASGCHDLHGERGECGALVATASEDGQRRGWEDPGHRACTLIGERGWLMERIAAEPEVTVRGLMTELAERGVAVSYGTVWNFIHREGMSFKKKRAAGRARSPRRGAPPGALEKISDED